MRPICQFILIMTLVAVGAACKLPPAEGASPKSQLIEARSVDLSTSTGIRRQLNLLVNDDSQWEAIWKELWKGREEIGGAPPQIDFKSQSVIVAALGGRPSGGYRVTIDVELSSPTELSILVTERKPDFKPGSKCIVTAVVTHPTSVVTVPVAAKTATFRSRTVTESCG